MLPCGNIVGLFLTTLPLSDLAYSESEMKLLLCLAVLLAFPAQAARRVGEAQVRAGANDVPCFTISQREERRAGAPDFHAVTVTEEGGGKGVLWRMAMPRER